MSELSILPQDETQPKEEPEIDPVKLGRIMAELRSEQSHMMAVLGGLAASVVAALAWATIGYFSGYTLGLVAVGVGFLVGYAVRFFGKGLDMSFGVIGAFFAIFGCLLGNLFIVVVFASQVEGASLATILSLVLISPGIVLEIFKETFSPIDLLFYGIAVYEAYKLSIRQISPEDLAGAQKPATDASIPVPPAQGS